ncbi:hypothetical protein LX90_000644 [Lentzea flava]|nr:hypothetical protein [Lentzea flava]
MTVSLRRLARAGRARPARRPRRTAGHRRARWRRTCVPVLCTVACVVFQLLEGVAALLSGEDALTAVVRALLVAGATIAGAGRHKRS